MLWSPRIRAAAFAALAAAAAAAAACGDLGTASRSVSPPRYATSGEDGLRARVVWEAARAMVGPTKATGYVWDSKNSVPSTYAYVTEDRGAWDSLRVHYPHYVSCREDNGTQSPYITGSCSSRYGTRDNTVYACQGTNCSSRSDFFSGQCKALQNLVLYRSGVYHKSGGWAFSTLPLDSRVPSVGRKATSGALRLGDVLRRPNGHSAIVVRIINNTSVVVFDSNWVGGDGYEHSGSHVMSFTGTGKITDLGTYYILDCVYNGTCA